MTWLWTIAAQKGISRLIQYIIILFTTGKVGSWLATVGVSVNIDPTLATAATLGAWEFVRNWLKNKVGIKFL